MSAVLTRRMLLFGSIPYRSTQVSEQVSKPVIKVDDPLFKCTLSVNTNDNNSAYFVMNHVEWYDPITNENKIDHVVKCFMVHEEEI